MDEARTPRSRTAFSALLVACALAGAGFVALGIWQVERLAWKEALIARVDRMLHASPVAAPGPTQWTALTREADEYRRVQVQGRFDYAHETLVAATTALGSGYWVLTPLHLDAGHWVLVNRGFVPPELRAKVPHAGEQQAVTGLLRLTEPHGRLLQKNDPAAGRWYSRDVAAIAWAQHLTGAVAPYFVDAQVPPGAERTWPRAGLTVVRFANDHLVYALTWFALAAIMAAAIGYLLLDARRQRRTPHAPTLADSRP